MSGVCHSPHEELNRGDDQPGFSAGDRCFEVFGQAPVTIEPGKGPFDYPAAGEGFEADGVGRALDDFDSPLTEIPQGVEQLLPGIGAIGKQMAQPRKEVVDRFDHEHRAVAILHISGMDIGPDQQAGGIGDDVAFTPFDLLAGIITARPAALGGLDRRLSITPAVGLASGSPPRALAAEARS